METRTACTAVLAKRGGAGTRGEPALVERSALGGSVSRAASSSAEKASSHDDLWGIRPDARSPFHTRLTPVFYA
jgi:hypothetical protein